jgi:phytoene dehydrogenase-like protein
MGRVSWCLADAARAAGALIATGVTVAAIEPGNGVVLDGGERIRATAVVSNADPRHTLGLVEGDVPPAFAARVSEWRDASPVLKCNVALRRLPRFPAASHHPDLVFRAQVEIASTIDETQAACVRARAGVPAPTWAELYFQTAYDRSVAPDGSHTLSVFAQYVPPVLAVGTWDDCREEIADATLGLVAQFAPDLDDCIIERQVLAPPDVEARIGLSGGHIFQGEILPDQMWTGRFAPRTPVSGLYLCGAATHPGGSVMAVNGRNAAGAVLADLGKALPPH